MQIALLATFFSLPVVFCQSSSCSCPSITASTLSTIASNISSTVPTPSPACQTAYAAELRELSSPDPSVSGPPTTYFQAMSSGNGTAQVGMQVQFQDLPATATHCQLQLQLPLASGAMNVTGPAPQVDIYQATVAPSSPASWDTSVFNASLPILKTLFLDGMHLANIYKANGLWNLSAVACNKTLTFQMGMRAPLSAPGGVDGVNYWAFTDIQPPASPVQGWHIVYGC
ncbi:hypothetical protein K491DRAFT_721075 [Lophiostoma macrostomum CBS 122681]|uniref:Ubiquitin 3 binding protein But2 C-terminal domain-containing protein n=1 Tax=Lophiostoma macrostomum CBS 122681 TaxID=1314788 RepID=A0A6A6SV74_9PLEO|nr:hypothetical protein K491DRAFT_721075 [Lophiostoma macrostomum CBS 122681]